MAAYTFKKAVREEVGLLIALIGSSGSGKSYSANRLASGICGPGEKYAVIDTENRRGLHYADMFDFDYLELHEPFRPEAYIEAIVAADKAGYKAIVVDSMSHVWAGVGGVLDWQEEELQRMAGDDYRKRESCKMAAWIKPKIAHKQMVQRLLQVRATLILCFRAEEKVKMEKDSNNKTVIVPIGWQPICDKNLPYEMTVSMLLTADAPGIPQFIKRQEQHKALFPDGKLIDENAGKAVSEWAKGGKATQAPTQDAGKLLADLKANVCACQSVDELRSLNGAINAAKSQMNDDQNEKLKQAWQARARELKPVEPAPTTSQPPSQEETLVTLIREKMRDDRVSQEDMDNLIGAVVGEVKPLEELIVEELNEVLAAMNQ